jgi:alkylated DNA repair protein (DNA oxidative demethylase)
METLPMFDPTDETVVGEKRIGPGTALLRGFAFRHEGDLLDTLRGVTEESPFRHMMTPGGFRMSVAMTNCGDLGWATDRTGYRYDPIDPQTAKPWPRMPRCFFELATSAAAQAGFGAFAPDSCLINRYEQGAKLSLHQDTNERDFTQPIVSVSLGIPAIFLFGGQERTDETTRIRVTHGDVIVWGGPARLRYHGVLPLKAASHTLTGEFRFNLTFRKAA